MAVILRCFIKFFSFGANNVRVVVEVRHLCDKSVAQRIYFRQYMIYDDILRAFTEKECVKEWYFHSNEKIQLLNLHCAAI